MTDWRAYFREMREREAARDDVVEDEPTVLLASFLPVVIPSSAPRAPAAIYRRLETAGWEVWMEAAHERVGRKFYMADSKDKDAGGEPKHRKGDPKSEAYDLAIWQVRGRNRTENGMVSALQCVWEQKKTCSFVDAFIWDYVTKEKELIVKMRDVTDWLDLFAKTEVKGKAA